MTQHIGFRLFHCYAITNDKKYIAQTQTSQTIKIKTQFFSSCIVYSSLNVVGQPSPPSIEESKQNQMYKIKGAHIHEFHDNEANFDERRPQKNDLLNQIYHSFMHGRNKIVLAIQCPKIDCLEAWKYWGLLGSPGPQ